VDEDLPIYDPPHRVDTDEDRYYLFKDSFTFTVVEGSGFGHGGSDWEVIESSF
jgi:hypothetical protein